MYPSRLTFPPSLLRQTNAPLSQSLEADDVGKTTLALFSPLCRCITGETIYVDNGLNIMGVAVDSHCYDDYPLYQNIRQKQKAEEAKVA